MEPTPSLAASATVRSTAAATWPFGLELVRARRRVASIDVVRGIVMVLMTLDHVRDWFGDPACNPLDLACTNAALYFTRWLTHYCASVFVLLAGVSAGLVGARSTTPALRWFLASRGVWLVVLELTVVHFAWNFNLRYEGGVVLQVIWALGASMIVLSGLVGLPARVIAIVGLALVCGHNAFDAIGPATLGDWAPFWTVLHVQGPTPFGLVLYPLVPWVGVMALGYVLADVYVWDAPRRRRTLVTIGTLATLGFVALRLANVYGDPEPWTAQSSPLRTLLSFLDVEKYPPSLLYLLVTLGPAVLGLALLDGIDDGGRISGVLATFGRVPLFFYVLHITMAHLAAGLVAVAMGFGTTVLGTVFVRAPDGWGFGLLVVYLAWVTEIALLVPLCRWFAAVKRRRTDWWLAYL